MREPLRVGIIGAGWVAAARHIPAFLRDRRARLMAVADHTEGRAEAVARRFDIPVYTTRLADLLERVDVVSICTPPWTHADLVTAALAEGRHVLVEKPLATNLADALAVEHAARHAGTRLCVAHNFLFSRSMQTALRVVESGRLGRLHTLFAFQLSSQRRRLPRWHARLPGGLFYDEAPHMVYLIRAFLGDLAVTAATIRVGPDGTPVRVSSRLASIQGEATLEMVFGAPLSEWALLVIGPGGTLLIDLFRDIALFLRPDRTHRPLDVLRTSLSAVAQHTQGVVASGWRVLNHRLTFGHDLLVRRFVDAVLGQAPVPVSVADGCAVVRVLDAILAAGG